MGHVCSMIEATKKFTLGEFLESVDERTVWTAHWYASGDPTDGGKARVPTLRVKQTDGMVQVAEMNEEKGRLLQDASSQAGQREDSG